MNIYFINICIDWVFKLYEDYIIGLKKFIKSTYSYNVHIHYLKNEFDSFRSFEKLYQKIKNQENKYKIILSGDFSFISKILNKFNNDTIYYLNIEQMSNESYYKCFREIPLNTNIIDYSEENIPFYKNIYNQTFLLPPYFKSLNNTCQNKDIDLLSLSNNEYRNSLLKKIDLENKYNKYFFNNIYGKERDNLYNQSKIYINIHCSEKHKTMELIRIINLLKQHVIIVTQNSIYKDLLFINKHLIIFEEKNDINIIIDEILNNYDKYYNYIFNNDFEKNYNDFVKKNTDLLFLN
jgi:hypothetical protein